MSSPNLRGPVPASALVTATLIVTALVGCSSPGSSTKTTDPAWAMELVPDPTSTLERTIMPKPAHPSLTVPAAFTQVAIRYEHQDGRPVVVTRSQVGASGYGGEHVTTVIGKDDGTIYGYTRQTADFSADALPSREEAEQAAFRLLNSIDPAFAQGLATQWIDRHDETVADANGAPAIVSGMKVKTRHTSGLYTWVIVGADNKIVTYERDVAWNTEHSRRQTAMWLHDAWVTSRDRGGAELGGMNAPLKS